MAAVDDVKELKGWKTDNSHDGVINIFIRRAVTLIKNYLHLDSNATNIENTYQDACVAYVMEQFDRKGNEATKQYSQGKRSGTYGSDLSENVKSLLPVPYARMMR